MWDSLLSSELKQETGQGLWVLCGEKMLFRQVIILGGNVDTSANPSRQPLEQKE